MAVIRATLKQPTGPPKIEDGIPLPLAQKSIYPFSDMKVGQSFFVDAQGRDVRWLQARVSSSVRGYVVSVKKNPPTFTTRQRHKPRDGEEGVRVWRIK